MSSSIAAYPQGLLSLLQSQNFGSNPKLLSEIVVPTVDVTDLYGLSQQYAPANTVLLAANNNDVLTVPAGKVWKVTGAGAIVIAGAGGAGRITLTVRTQSQNVPISDTLTFAATETRLLASLLGKFYLRAGDRINVWCDGLAGAPTVTVTALVSELVA